MADMYEEEQFFEILAKEDPKVGSWLPPLLPEHPPPPLCHCLLPGSARQGSTSLRGVEGGLWAEDADFVHTPAWVGGPCGGGAELAKVLWGGGQGLGCQSQED